MKRYLNPPDNRPLDDWGLPIGKPYEKKKWDELNSEEMMIDFEWKSDILDAYGEEVSADTFYQDYLFRELYEGELEGYEYREKIHPYKVVLLEYYEKEPNEEKSKTKIHKVDIDDIYKYLSFNNVAISPCLFYRNWRRKNLLNYVSAFVLDIDKLRPKQLQRFLQLFDEGRLLRPTFIANSGSGVHFYYLLDQMFPIDSVQHEANNLVAEEIYTKLYDDVILKEKWKDAQRHWLGQDYRVVNSRTKLNLMAQIFKVGEIYTIEDLIEHYQVKIDRKKNYASKKMISYAGSIAKTLDLTPPDYSDSEATYKFIAENKDAAYKVREERRQIREEKRKNCSKRKKRKKSKPGSWYKNTLYHMMNNTSPGFRFSSMKALAIIAFKEKIPRETFIMDLHALSAYWQSYDWGGDNFNSKNVSSIERFFDQAKNYGNTSSETLEEWLGWKFNRIGTKKNGRTRAAHLVVMNNMKAVKKQLGEEINEGRPVALSYVQEFRYNHPKATKAECNRATGLDPKTIRKWWEAAEPSRLHKIAPSEEFSKNFIEELRALDEAEKKPDSSADT